MYLMYRGLNCYALQLFEFLPSPWLFIDISLDGGGGDALDESL